MSISDMAKGIYNLYPRKVANRAALKAITFALTRLHDGEFNDEPMEWEDAFKFLVAKTRQYASSPAGNRETLTPHPSTFYNQSRYLDNEIEWYRMTPEETKTHRNSIEANIGVWRPE